jgi:hypothetical protein
MGNRLQEHRERLLKVQFDPTRMLYRSLEALVFLKLHPVLSAKLADSMG